MSAPSIYLTHCDGAGGLPTTPIWGNLRRKIYMNMCEELATRDLPERQDLSGKTIIVSGSNSGIGKEAAFTFASWGAKVIMACRDAPAHEQHPKQTIEELLSRGADIKPSQLEWWEVDFADLESVRSFGRKWRESGLVCDILANNAGLGGVHGQITTKDGFELVNQVNFLAHCLMTFYVLPSMKKSAAPRIINTTSCFHFGGLLDFANFNNEKRPDTSLHALQSYCDSKLRLQVWTAELQRRLSRSDDYAHVIVQGCHPGFVKSNLWNNPTIRSLPWPLPQLLDAVLSRLSIDPKQGSLAIVHSALRPNLGLPERYVSQAQSGQVNGSDKKKKASGRGDLPPVPQGLTAAIGGQFVRKTTANYEHRPECDDAFIRCRLWQRVLEDLDVDTGADELAKGLPAHPNAVLDLEA